MTIKGTQENTAAPAVTSFETLIEELQSVVRNLESGSLSLEESLKAFESGVQLSRMGQKMLAEAEQKVEILANVNPEGRVETRTFQAGDTPGEGTGGPRA